MKEDVFNQYVEKVMDIFNISKKELFSKSKKRHIVDARQMLYYLCHTRPMKYIIIQKYMMDNKYKIAHNSIINGVKVVEGRIKEDKDYQDILREIEKSVFI
jgi:chromosomal replication initiation ATPase DnaA